MRMVRRSLTPLALALAPAGLVGAAEASPVRIAQDLPLLHPGALPLLLLQVLCVLGFAKGLALLLRRVWQPPVVVEILAGVMLGPTLLGSCAPAVSHVLFPAQGLADLALIGQVGVVIALFVVGMELDTRIARKAARTVVLITQTTVVLPFLLGCGCAWLLHPLLAPAGVPVLPFVLFVGIAMSITAFPVLARILTALQLQTTTLGALALTTAALGDVTAWCGLAAVVAVARSTGPTAVVIHLVGAVVFTLVMLLAVRPLLRQLLLRPGMDARNPPVAFVLVYLLAAALLGEVVGVHALYGAFLAGLAMPRHDELRAQLTQRIAPVAEIVLLPVFFALAGLRADLHLVAVPGLWLPTLLVIALAILGKVGGGALTARATGLSWRAGLLLGALLNTRGLMELVVLGIGLDLGILDQRAYAVLVLMALVTTCMTGPLVRLLAPRSRATLGVTVSVARWERGAQG